MKKIEIGGRVVVSVGRSLSVEVAVKLSRWRGKKVTLKQVRRVKDNHSKEKGAEVTALSSEDY